MTDQELQKIAEFIINDLEGRELTNYSNDPGGLTKFGISQRWNPDIDVENLTYDEAVEIYLKKFRQFNIDKMPFDIGCFIAQWGWLRGYVNTFKKIQLFLDLKPDGIFGPISFKRLNEVIKNQMYIKISFINQLQKLYVADVSLVCFLNPNLISNLEGWINRVYKTVAFIDKELEGVK